MDGKRFIGGDLGRAIEHHYYDEILQAICGFLYLKKFLKDQDVDFE